MVLVIGQLILLTLQVRGEGGQPSLLETGVVGVVSPVAVAVDWVASRVKNFAGQVSLNRTLTAENRRLREELADLQIERIRHFGLEQDLERLSRAVSYERAIGASLQAANIVFIDHASWLQTALVSVPSGQARLNQPVVSADGLVGRVVLLTGRYAKIQLITDRAASVGAMIERTRRQGVLQGSGRGVLELEFVPRQSDVRVGDRIVTAGIDGVYPRGIPVGTVTSVEAGDELFHEIAVVPRVDFGLLDHVFLLGTEEPPTEIVEEQPGARP